MYLKRANKTSNEEEATSAMLDMRPLSMLTLTQHMSGTEKKCQKKIKISLHFKFQQSINKRFYLTKDFVVRYRTLLSDKATDVNGFLLRCSSF
jgi:hypothetical protein